MSVRRDRRGPCPCFLFEAGRQEEPKLIPPGQSSMHPQRSERQPLSVHPSGNPGILTLPLNETLLVTDKRADDWAWLRERPCLFLSG